MESDDAPRRDRDFLAGLGIAARALGFVAQQEIAEARQLDAVTSHEGRTDLLEEGLDHVLCFALVEPDLVEQHIGQFGLGQRRILPGRRHPVGQGRRRLEIGQVARGAVAGQSMR